MNKEKLIEILQKEINEKEQGQAMLNACKKLVEYYFDKTDETKGKMNRLMNKYNRQTILDYLGPNGYPEDYTHVTLFHGSSLKTMYPTLDNGGGIYDDDEEIGVIIEEPEFTFDIDMSSEETWIAVHSYHSKILLTWLSLIWLEIEGYKYGVVVKTLENNSIAEFYFNDFSWGKKSKFFLAQDWQPLVDQYTIKEMDLNEIYNAVSKDMAW